MSRQSFGLCLLAYVVACSFSRNRFSELFLGFCRDIVLMQQSCSCRDRCVLCRDIVFMQQSYSCRDRCVLCRDIKFVTTSFSYFLLLKTVGIYFSLSRPIFCSLQIGELNSSLEVSKPSCTLGIKYQMHIGSLGMAIEDLGG